MANSLRIEIKADTEENIYDFLRHVFREITDESYKNADIELNSKIDNDWLVVEANSLKGKYYWTKE